MLLDDGDLRLFDQGPQLIKPRANSKREGCFDNLELPPRDTVTKPDAGVGVVVMTRTPDNPIRLGGAVVKGLAPTRQIRIAIGLGLD